MKIDRDNYEIYFLDYLEGNLPAEETAELLIFVENNPDLKDLIEDNDLIKLEPDQSISFLGKSALKKNDLLSLKISENKIIITLKNCEEYFIRFYENDLIDPEKIVLANFLKENPSFIKEFELFGNTFIKPDLEIVYPFKSKLKRRTILLPNVKRILTISAIAASVLLFSTVYLQYISQPTSSTTQQKIAQTVAGPNTTKKDTKSTISNVDDNRPTINSVPHTNSMLAALDKNQAAPTISNRIQAQLPTTLLSTRYSGDLALNQKQIPQSIERRTDFDGVTSTAYFNPDPDAAPLNSDGRIINGKLGYALAQGISQAAGSLARDPEAGRLLNGRILLSDIARLGLKGYNLITDRNLSLTEEYDSTGTKTGYALSDGNRRISRFLNRLGR
ncbi:MAG: hypothetical protein HXX14_00635 [Bacteroidetes bacterium]|nr:hypothetical protein [Bacteroidota bacterium]